MAEQALEETISTVTDPRSGRLAGRIAVVAAGAVIIVVAGLFLVPDQQEPVGPSPSPSESRNPLEHRATIPPITDEMVQPVFDPADIDQLPWRDGVTRSWDPIDAVPLEEDPVEHALVAHQSTPDQPDAISVLGDDGRWRSLDLTDVHLSHSHEFDLGVHRTSLSPDGTRLALGLGRDVMVVDLTTANTTTFKTPGIGPAWKGRYTAWSDSGDTVYVGTSYWYADHGLAIDLATGVRTKVPFQTWSSAFLDDGGVVERHFEDEKPADVRRYDASGELELVTVPSHDILGAMSSISANGNRIAAVTEQTWSTDVAGKEPRRSGILVLGADARPEALLPVEGFQDNSEGGAVLGWIDADTVLLGVLPDLGADRAAVLAWEIDSGRISRIADHASGSAVSVAASHL